jgi:hemolysin III
MGALLMVEAVFPRYNTPLSRFVDKLIHIAGLVFAVVGGFVLLALALENGRDKTFAILLYAACFVAMLSASMAYSFADQRRQPFMRRLDHAGIFLMIAGSYTPFTMHVLTGAWAWGMTSAVWTIAAIGILFKLFWPDLREGVSIALYVALGWIVLIAAGPIFHALAPPVLALLIAGGVIYTVGVLFHIKEDWRFARPIWHGHVVVAAGLHWVAVLLGVVLRAG